MGQAIISLEMIVRASRLTAFLARRAALGEVKEERMASMIIYETMAGASRDYAMPVRVEMDDYDEPDVDDSVRFCPECETPNQFGEICGRCQREIEMEANQDE